MIKLYDEDIVLTTESVVCFKTPDAQPNVKAIILLIMLMMGLENPQEGIKLSSLSKTTWNAMYIASDYKYDNIVIPQSVQSKSQDARQRRVVQREFSDEKYEKCFENFKANSGQQS